MMIVIATMKRPLLTVLAAVFVLIALCQPLYAQTSTDTSEQPIVYRGDQYRTGFLEANGVPKLTGAVWQKNIGEAGVSSPVYVDGTIYLGTNRGEMLALDAATGDQKWAFTSVGGNASSPAIEGDVVYVGLGLDPSGTGLYALSRQTGEQLWSFKTTSPIWLASPLIFNGKVYFGDLDGNFFAVDTQTHEKVWSIDVNRAVYWNAAADEDTLYFTASSGLYAVDINTGKQRWQVSKGADWAPLALDNGVVYAGNLNHQFYALDGKTGQEIWTFKDTPMDRSNWSAPALADGIVYVGNRTGNMYAFDTQTGKQLWKFKADAPATSDPMIANGVLYFGVGSHGNESAGEDEGYFYALDVATGSALWQFKSKGEILNGPAISESSVYFLTAGGSLYNLQ